MQLSTGRLICLACGDSQDAFVENYLTSQRSHVFSHVGVLIYVFDVETREFDRDLVTFGEIARALSECSPNASVFCLIHKMDLVQDNFKAKLLEERIALIKDRSDRFNVECFATSIWDQSLYKAWANIIWTLIPNLRVIEEHLQVLLDSCEAEEVVLFERTTFLVITHVTSDIGKMNPCADRFEKLSNIIKTFKQTLTRHTGLPKSSPQFIELAIKVSKFNMFVARFTANTYILVVTPPGETTFNGAVLNTKIAVEHFEKMDGLGKAGLGSGPSAPPATAGPSGDGGGTTRGESSTTASAAAATEATREGSGGKGTRRLGRLSRQLPKVRPQRRRSRVLPQTWKASRWTIR